MTTPNTPEDARPAIPLGEYRAHAEPNGVFEEVQEEVKEPEREEDILRYEAGLLKKEEQLLDTELEGDD